MITLYMYIHNRFWSYPLGRKNRFPPASFLQPCLIRGLNTTETCAFKIIKTWDRFRIKKNINQSCWQGYFTLIPTSVIFKYNEMVLYKDIWYMAEQFGWLRVIWADVSLPNTFFFSYDLLNIPSQNTSLCFPDVSLWMRLCSYCAIS